MVEQLDLFGEEGAAAAAPEPPPLNGYYYEKATDKFVSFVLGVRYYEMPAKGCEFTKEWQERIKRERAI